MPQLLLTEQPAIVTTIILKQEIMTNDSEYSIRIVLIFKCGGELPVLKLPSYPAAILTGSIVLPLFVWGAEKIELIFKSRLLFFAWSIIGFVIPALFSTTDINYARDIAKRNHSIFRVKLTPENTEKLFYPAWKRMAILFVSAVTSFIFINFISS